MRSGWGCGAVILLAAAALLVILTYRGTRGQPAPKPVATASVGDCDALVAQARRQGLIVRRPDPMRVDVDEAAWGRLPARAQASLLQAVGCAALGRPLGDADRVEAYGARSGAKLAAAGPLGLDETP